MSDAFAQRWRKLYRHPSTSWQALPLSARGLGDELVRIADDEGSVHVGDSPAETVSRLLAAHRSEYRRVARDLELLLQDGFCSITRGRLWIRNWELAQGGGALERGEQTQQEQASETPEERSRRLARERVARYRERNAASVTGNAETVTATVTGNADGNAETVTGNALPSRALPSEEERREEKEQQPSSAGARETVTATVTGNGPEGCPSLRQVLDAVSHWSKGRISELVSTADGRDLERVIRQLYERDQIVLYDYEVLGSWACKQDGGPGFPTLKRPPSWSFLLGEDRGGSRLIEALGESRHWRRLEDERDERRSRRAG